MQAENLRLHQIYGIPAPAPIPTVRLQQEYFLIERDVFVKRPDLVLTGRTVYGAKSTQPKENQSLIGRKQAFIRAVEAEAAQQGLILHMRGREVLCDALHHPPLTQIMHRSAEKQGLVCLFHEKPFAGIQGSDTFYHWSPAIDVNHALARLTISTAVTHAVHEHADLFGLFFTSFEEKDSVFVFRAAQNFEGSAFPVCVLHAIIADSLQLLLDETKDALQDGRDLSEEETRRLVLPVLQQKIKTSRSVDTALFGALLDQKTERCFQGILSAKELRHRYEHFVESYVKAQGREAHVMLDCFYRISVIPSEKALHAAQELEKMLAHMADLGWEAKAKVFSELGLSKMKDLRSHVDAMEAIVDDALWPMPKYQELLYGVQ